jgi:transcriptional regulator with XRE-family HTH domain
MTVTQTTAFGALLRRWRTARRLSQLDLGLEAGVSPRHISFIETGRASPSREMVLLLSTTLDVPLRESNALLNAAGYAPIYRETDLDDPQMAQARQALRLLLKQQEPFSAMVYNRYGDVLMGNAAWVRFQKLLFGAETASLTPLALINAPRPNALRMLFDPVGWRSYIVNWETVARTLLARLHRQVTWERDDAAGKLLQELLAYPGIPARWREPDLDTPQTLLVPVEVRVAEQTLRFFTTLTTLGSPQDITLQELRIETFHPVDEETESAVRQAAALCP